MSDVVPPQIPLVLHLLLTDLAVHLPPHRVHVQDVLRKDKSGREVKSQDSRGIPVQQFSQ